MIVIISIIFSLVFLVFAPNINIYKNLFSNAILPDNTKTNFTTTKYYPSPKLKNNSSNFVADAKIAAIYDVKSGKVLYQKNQDEQAPIASLTKLMTALTIMQNHSPDETVIINSNLPDLSPDDQKINLVAGSRFKLSELMKAMLIYSANDVANALAIWDSGSIENFTNKMNQNAKIWGMNNSSFSNPSGLDNQANLSSAGDLIKISAILLHNEKFRNIINTQKSVIYDLDGNSYPITTTNQLLNLPYIYGIKTGFTTQAGECLILLAKKEDNEIITIVLNSPERFTESKNMVNYTFDNYIWE